MKLGGSYALHMHKDGELHSFLPGDELPEWAAAKIDNPHTRAAATDAAEPAMPDVVPAKKGPGASRQAWEDYALAQGIAVEADWKREDIIAAVEAAR